jgi:hypothetical protein
LPTTCRPDASAADPGICAAIASYVANWVENSGLPIRYIVGLCGLPSRDNSGYECEAEGTSVSDLINNDIFKASEADGVTGDSYSWAGALALDGVPVGGRFTTAQYGAPLVAWLDCGTYQATYAYITKEILVADNGGLCADGITISASAANLGGSTWQIDDVHHAAGYDSCDGYGEVYSNLPGILESDGVSASDINYDANDNSIQYPATQPDITSATDPTAYCSWGVHSGNLRSSNFSWWDIPGSNDPGGSNPNDAWPVTYTNGTTTYEPAQVTFTFTNRLNVGWWAGTTNESFNGCYGFYMGNPEEFFAPSAFGGTTAAVTVGAGPEQYYTNTPICFVGSTEEPSSGVVNAQYFSAWAKGWTSVEAAWYGYSTAGSGGPIVAVTDLFIQQ